MNEYRGNSFQQSVSGVSNLNNGWYDGQLYQAYGLEIVPSEDDSGGYARFFVGYNATWHIDPLALRPNGNVGWRVIPREPMTLVFNLGMSESFSRLNFTGLATLLPATMRVDYIRIYQDPRESSGQNLTCDPPGYETTEYIASHPKSYLNPNFTTW